MDQENSADREKDQIAKGDTEQKKNLISRGIDSIANHFKADEKTKHQTGDFYFGYAKDRNAGMNRMLEDFSKFRSKPEPPDTIHIMATLNNMVIDTLGVKGRERDWMKFYFDLIKTIETTDVREFKDKCTDSPVAVRWFEFLKKNIEYVKLDKAIDSMRSETLSKEPTKARLHKNVQIPCYYTETKSKEIIIEAFDKKEGSKNGSEMKVTNQWTNMAFFRKTSKLGIDFVLKEGNVVHFNIHSRFDPSGQRSLANEASNPQINRKQPITHSEIRKIGRDYGHDHSQIDMYSCNLESNITRKKNMGEITNDKLKKTKDKKTTSRRHL